LWEPKLNSAASLDLAVRSILDASISDNATDAKNEHHLWKRYVTVAAGTGNADIQLWPAKTIKYCFENSNARSILFDDLMDAVQRWYASGLPEDQFKYQEVSASECTSNRANVLLIKYSAPGTGPGQSSMATTPAKVPRGPGVDGPTMVLTDDDTMGHLDKVANYAHELGHAWGLYHEHQNPYFWESAYGNEDGSRFGATNFNCQNLKDYADVQRKIQEKIDNYPNGLGEVVYGSHFHDVCVKRSVAKEYKFSAYDYLPFPLSECVPGTTSENEIDWESIMIYPSGAGGTGTAAAGGPDTRNPILLKPNGDRIDPVLYPSSEDIEGIERLYGKPEVQDDNLLSDPKSKKNNRFRTVWNKVKGSQGGQGCL
jgi:hypothetical protein